MARRSRPDVDPTDSEYDPKRPDIDSRKSTRAKTKKRALTPDGGTTGPRKKARITRKKGKNSKDKDAVVDTKQIVTRKSAGRGSLMLFMDDIPLDIVVETFSYLKSQDLLNISRTSKALRSVVLHRSFASAWKAARNNLDPPLPDLPEDMSEPEYANLAFDTHCHVCDASRCNKGVVWSCRIRCCAECLGWCFEQEHRLRYLLKDNYSEALKDLGEGVLSKIVPGCWLVGENSCHEYYHLSREIAENLLTEYMTLLTSPEAKQSWLEQKKKDLKVINIHSELCEEWDIYRSAHRKDELAQIREERATEILQRLSEEGWAEEVDQLTPEAKSEFHLHKCVKVSKELTDHHWENIKEEMYAFMETQHDLRMNASRKKVIRRRWMLFNEVYKAFKKKQEEDPSGLIIPSCADFVRMPPIASIVEDTPKEQTLKLQAFDPVINQMPQLCMEWRESCTQKLLELIEGSSRYAKSTIRPTLDYLNLATTLFSCDMCTRKLSYSRVLSHSCCSSRGSAYYRERRGDDVLDLVDLADCVHSVPWSTSVLTFQTEDIWKRRSLIELCGLNPDTTTADDIEKLDVAFIRKYKSDGSYRNAIVMGWEFAIREGISGTVDSDNDLELLSDSMQDSIASMSCHMHTCVNLQEGQNLSITDFKQHHRQSHVCNTWGGSETHFGTYPTCRVLLTYKNT